MRDCVVIKWGGSLITDKETMCSVSMVGLYPTGEGAGYAGGIVSAACDGLAAAEAILRARV